VVYVPLGATRHRSSQVKSTSCTVKNSSKSTAKVSQKLGLGERRLELSIQRVRLVSVTAANDARCERRSAWRPSSASSAPCGLASSRVFCAMWLGFFTLYVARGVSGSDHLLAELPHWLDAFLFWLGYANSTVNPILYAVFNVEFRRAYQTIFGHHLAASCCS